MTEIKDIYWTAFTFKSQPNPNTLHVTHKYLGELSGLDADLTLKIIKDYWKEYPLKTFFAKFSVEDYFHSGTLRILKEPATEVSPFKNFFKLRNQLDPFRVDDWAFNPHVTTKLPKVHAYIDSYVFMRNIEIVDRWYAV